MQRYSRGAGECAGLGREITEPWRLFNLGLRKGVWGPERSGKTYYLPKKMQTELFLSSSLFNPSIYSAWPTNSGWPASKPWWPQHVYSPGRGMGQLQEQPEPHPPPEDGSAGTRRASGLPDFIRLHQPPPPLGSGLSLRAAHSEPFPALTEAYPLLSASGSASQPRAAGSFCPVTSVRARVNPGARKPACPFTPHLGPRPADGLAPREGDAPGLRETGFLWKAGSGCQPTPRSDGPDRSRRPRATATSSRHRPGRRCSVERPWAPLRPPALGFPQLSALTRLSILLPNYREVEGAMAKAAALRGPKQPGGQRGHEGRGSHHPRRCPRQKRSARAGRAIIPRPRGRPRLPPAPVGPFPVKSCLWLEQEEPGARLWKPRKPR